ncbi:MAG: polysaccharide deacetylase family protein [Desulfobulbus sp.]|jgi:peptidoglycan/xylan/chitin deacetylase (PgdA/CDA1 family)
MLNVFFTVDTEVWCGGWSNIDEVFADMFKRYIYGPTKYGEYGLPFQLKLLEDYGLKAVFFVEPLFSCRFGGEYLDEIIRLITDFGQEVQLHIHPEWIDEFDSSLLEKSYSKKSCMYEFSYGEQVQIIKLGKKLIESSGGGEVTAFRAGNFGYNAKTLLALKECGIYIDSCYNASFDIVGNREILSDGYAFDPFCFNGVWEYPMTVFRDGRKKMRHAQLGACSYREMETLLWKALEEQREAFVILSHNFELLNQRKDRPDRVVVRRMQKLCQFFDKNRDSFCLRGFRGLSTECAGVQRPPLQVPAWQTFLRVAEQIYRRRYH